MIHIGDCREVMATMDAESVDAVVTDPPYGLEFMGKEWDSFKTGRSAKYSKGGSIDTEAMARQSGKGGAGPSYVNRPAKRCTNCGKQQWSGSPCECDEPRWIMDNSPLHAFQAWSETWAREAFRVLKPGGHLLAFGGTRTAHRMVCAIEDAGFEIRDQIVWMYGSGFPKSLDVGKAIDRKRQDDVRPVCRFLAAHMGLLRITDIVKALGFAGNGDHGVSAWFREDHVGPRVPTWDQWLSLKSLLGFDDTMDAEVWRLNGRKGQPEHERPDRVVSHPGNNSVFQPTQRVIDAGTPVTDLARRWDGWGTALKPAHEPIVVARKPLIGTVAANVARYGTGALNIDASRIGGDYETRDRNTDGGHSMFGLGAGGGAFVPASGRWPSNVILSHSPDCRDGVCVEGCPVRLLDEQSGERPSGFRPNRPNHKGGDTRPSGFAMTKMGDTYADQGGSSRFFLNLSWQPGELDEAARFIYTAKASRRERNAGLEGMPPLPNQTLAGGEFRPNGRNATSRTAVGQNHHPTVKPIALMRYLVRLVTPPDGLILDPFAGSGTTGIAASLEGFRFVGIEQDAGYAEIARRRIANATPPLLAMVAD
jgi:DNA modification methylase